MSKTQDVRYWLTDQGWAAVRALETTADDRADDEVSR